MWRKGLIVAEVVGLLLMLSLAELVAPPVSVPFRTKMAIAGIYLVVRAVIAARRRRPGGRRSDWAPDRTSR